MGVISKDSQVQVLHLDPFSEKDILNVVEGCVSDPKQFLKEAQQRGIFDLLTNPQTLELMLQVMESGYWPETRIELYQKACEIMAGEFNDEHARSLPGSTKIEDILYSAGALCAYQLLASTKGFSHTQLAADNDFPWIGILKCYSKFMRAF